MSSLLCPEVNVVLEAIGPQNATKVLLLGNSGVGKSLLLNVLLENDEFRSEFSSTAVTRKIEMDVLNPSADDKIAYLLYNIPGLLDPSETVAAENSVQIEKAFRDRGEPPIVTFFVLTVEGGRLRAEDLEAWRTIAKFVPDIETETAVAFIVNKMDPDDFDSKAKQTNYELNLQRQIRAYCLKPYAVYFLPKLSSADKKSPTSAGRIKMRNHLMTALRRLRGRAVRVAEGSRLKLHNEIMKEEIAKTKQRMAEMEAKFAREQNEKAEAYRVELAAMEHRNEERAREATRAHEKEMEILKAQITELKSRPQPEIDLQKLIDRLDANERAAEESHQRQMQALTQTMAMMHIGSSHRERSPRREQVLGWNQFQIAHGGCGYSRADMSHAYAKYRRECGR